MRPYFEQWGIRIFHGDCREVVPGLEGVPDAVVTDPPYGETSLEWDRWVTGWLAMLRARGVPQLWCYGSFRMFMRNAAEFLASWELAQDVVWEKHNGSGLHNDRFRRVHELAAHFYQGEWGKLYLKPPIVTVEEDRKAGRRLRRAEKPAHFGKADTGAGYDYDGTRIMRSVIPVRSCHGHAEHPTQKPEGIVRPLLECSVPPGGEVWDLFCGSGTTLVVAKQLGLRGVGMDVDEKWCEVAAKRLCGTLL